jgi:hypothetical protein
LTDAMLTIVPRPWATIGTSAARVIRSVVKAIPTRD